MKKKKKKKKEEEGNGTIPAPDHGTGRHQVTTFQYHHERRSCKYDYHERCDHFLKNEKNERSQEGR